MASLMMPLWRHGTGPVRRRHPRASSTRAAEASGEEARALADRLAAPLDAAIRLALQDALAAAAEEITVELAPGSVELRLRGRNPEFVVTPPPADPPADDATWTTRGAGALPAADGDEGSVARINLRLPEHLKERIERGRRR